MGKKTAAIIAGILGAGGGLACILQWLEIKPKDLWGWHMPLTAPHWLWLIFGLLLFSISIGLSAFSLRRTTNRGPNTQTDPGPDIQSSIERPPIVIGLTFECAEADVSSDSSAVNYKFKLRVYLANYTGETIHLGVPTWTEGVPPQGGHLTYAYQLRQPQNPKQPWGDEAKELDVPAGRRCRIWLGLDPARREEALKLLDAAQLGLLVVPASTANYSVNVRIRPGDRGLTQLKAREYEEQKRVVAERFMGMDHAAKEAVRFLSFGRVMSAQRIADHLRENKFPDADKVVDRLRDDIVPLVSRYGSAEYRINPALEKIVKEVVAADKKEFIETARKLPADQFLYKSKNEPGFEARYNTIAPKD